MSHALKVTVAVLAVCPVPLAAQTNPQPGPLTVSGIARARVEVIDGQFRPGVADTGALLLRFDVAAEYDFGSVRIGGEVQDSRVYFARRPSSISTSDVNAFEPIQAYLAADLSDTAQARAGRFTLNLGSRRLVARNNFRNTVNAFTGIRFDWAPRKDSGVTLFWTLPLLRRPDDAASLADNEFRLDRERDDQQFYGAFGKVARHGLAVEGYLYRFYERDDAGFATRNRRLWTVGGRVLRAPAKAGSDFDLEAAWQSGRTRASAAAADVNDLNVAAWFGHASIGHTFAAAWSPRIAVAYDYASGDGRGRGYARFDTLFGARVFEFGPTSLYGPVGRANLSSPEARLEVKPDRKWDGYLAVRGLWLADRRDSFASTGVRDATGVAGRHAGTQFDARVRRWLVPEKLRLAAGAAYLARGRFLRDALNAPADGDTKYGFVELTASF